MGSNEVTLVSFSDFKPRASRHGYRQREGQGWPEELDRVQCHPCGVHVCAPGGSSGKMDCQIVRGLPQPQLRSLCPAVLRVAQDGADAEAEIILKTGSRGCHPATSSCFQLGTDLMSYSRLKL